MVTGFLLVLLVAPGAAESSPPAFPDLGKDDAIILESGKIIRGTITKRTTKGTYIEVDGKRKGYKKDSVVGASWVKGKTSDRAAMKRLWGKTKGTADAWYAMGRECLKRKLEVEGVISFEHALKIDPDHEKAHRILGHALFEGKWLDRAAVRKKVAEGYVKRSGKLVKKGTEEGEGRTAVKKEKKKWPEQQRRILSAPKLSGSQLSRYASERKSRASDAQKFKKQMQAEYLGVPWSKKHTLKTRNYIIECNSTKAVASRYANTMKKLYAMLSKHFPSQRKGLKGKSVVRIYRNGDDFREQTGMFMGVGGFYRPSNGELCAYHGTFGLTATTFNVLAHEGTHQFQGKVLSSFQNTPMWLIEGMAVYFGDGAQITPSGKLVTERIPRDRLLHIQEKIRNGRYERLEKLVTLGRRGFSGSHYADSWALVHFLVNSGKQGQDLLSAYWNLANNTKIELKHFEQVATEHSGSIAALEKKYLDHVMALRPDAAGEIRGDHYYSSEFCFELEKLGKKWEFFEDYRPGFLIGQLLPNTTAEIIVSFNNNDERAQSGQDYVKKYVLRFKDKLLPLRYSNIKAKKATLGGAKGFRFTYEDGGSRSGGSISIDDLMEELRRGRSGLSAPKGVKKGKARKYVEFLIVGFDGTFSVQVSAEKAEFATFEKDFHRLEQCFTPIHQRRW